MRVCICEDQTFKQGRTNLFKILTAQNQGAQSHVSGQAQPRTKAINSL